MFLTDIKKILKYKISSGSRVVLYGQTDRRTLWINSHFHNFSSAPN